MQEVRDEFDELAQQNKEGTPGESEGVITSYKDAQAELKRANVSAVGPKATVFMRLGRVRANTYDAAKDTTLANRVTAAPRPQPFQLGQWDYRD